jgi:membrane protease YdiL (CAAX protease family)
MFFAFMVLFAFLYTLQVGTNLAMLAGIDAQEMGGLTLLVGYTTGTLGGLLVLIFIIRMRQTVAVSDYLGLRWPTVRVAGVSLLIMTGIIIAVTTTASVAGLDLITESMLEQFRAARYPVLLIIAYTCISPIFEEALFRGFILRGLCESRLGLHMGAGLTCLFWTLVYMASFGVIADFDAALLLTAEHLAVGALLVYTQVYGRSLYLCILLHGLWNLVSLVMTLQHPAL